MRSLLTRRVCFTLTNYAMLAFTSIANAGIFPLFLFTPVHLGGLGFSEAKVSLLLVALAEGDLQSLTLTWPPDWNGHVMPSCLYHCMPNHLFRAHSAALGYGGNLSLRGAFLHSWLFDVPGDQLDGAAPTRSWLREHAGYLCCFGYSDIFPSHGKSCKGNHEQPESVLTSERKLFAQPQAYSCNMLLINASAPKPQLLGTLNGMAQMLSSLVRSAGLAIGPALFAVSKQKNLLGGQAVWVFMVASSLGLSGTSWLVSDAKADWREDIVKVTERDEDEAQTTSR